MFLDLTVAETTVHETYSSLHAITPSARVKKRVTGLGLARSGHRLSRAKDARVNGNLHR